MNTNTSTSLDTQVLTPRWGKDLRTRGKFLLFTSGLVFVQCYSGYSITTPFIYLRGAKEGAIDPEVTLWILFVIALSQTFYFLSGLFTDLYRWRLQHIPKVIKIDRLKEYDEKLLAYFENADRRAIREKDAALQIADTCDNIQSAFASFCEGSTPKHPDKETQNIDISHRDRYGRMQNAPFDESNFVTVCSKMIDDLKKQAERLSPAIPIDDQYTNITPQTEAIIENSRILQEIYTDAKKEVTRIKYLEWAEVVLTTIVGLVASGLSLHFALNC